MKNKDKIAAAEEIVAFARSNGFEDAHLQFIDGGSSLGYDTLEELSEDYGCDEPITAIISVILDQELGFSLVADPDDEDGEPEIQFAK